MNSLLSVRDLHIRYPLAGGLGQSLGFSSQPRFVEVVQGVSLDIQRGQTLAIVGESGSGKTTLAMALCGLVPITKGEVHFDGQRLSHVAGEKLYPDHKRVALMFQDPVGSLSPRMTVRKLLSEPFAIHAAGSHDPDEEASRLLTLVGLGKDFLDRYPHQLSGGQARRIGLARALALKPDLLIADEPTAGLDVSIQGEVLNLLSGLQQEMGLGILVITHNLNIVRHVADQMAIMYLGRFVEQGDSKQIFQHPRHPYTAALLSANPSADTEAQRHRISLVGEVPSLLHRPAGCEFHSRCPRAEPRCKREFPPRSGTPDSQAFHCLLPLE